MRVIHNNKKKAELKEQRRREALVHMNRRIKQLNQLCENASTKEEYDRYYHNGVFLTQVRNKTAENIERFSFLTKVEKPSQQTQSVAAF